MEKKGSILIIALILLAAIEIMVLTYIGMTKSFRTSLKYSKMRGAALYNAEEGINVVMNILMRDPDNDFTTAGDKSEENGYYPAIPYTFDFKSMQYQVVALNSTTNPISNTLKKSGIDTTVSYFDPAPRTIWVKSTGYYYPGTVSRYKSIVAGGNAAKIQAYKSKIVKRTIVCKIATSPPPPPPHYPFKHTLFSCGKINEMGLLHVEGNVCSPTIDKMGLVSNDSECTPVEGQDACNNEGDSLTNWIDETCADPATIHHPESEQNLDLLQGGPGGTHCYDSDFTWANILSPSPDPVDADGDGDYDEPGDVAPPVLIVRGDLDIVGAFQFKGIIVCEGKVTVGALADITGTIIGVQGIDILALAAFHEKDYSGRVIPKHPPYTFDTKVDRSLWFLADKPIHMTIGGQEYDIITSNISVPNPQ